jgi:OOP family OmpA-OmpF porin
LLFSFNVLAQETGFYAGGSIGYSNFGDDAGEDVQDIESILASSGITTTSITSDLDDTDIGWKFFGGYMVNDYLGLEAGYVDLGETSLDLDITALVPPSATPVTVNTVAAVGVDGFTLNGVLAYPVNEQFDVFAKGGAFFWSADLDVEATASGFPPETFSDDDSGTDFTFGVGGRFYYNEYISLRAEWERYSGITDSDGDVDLFSGGVEWHF